MIGDMFNNGLKAKVDALCNELSDLLSQSGMLAPPSYQSQSQSSGGSHNSFNSTGRVSLFVAGGPAGNWWPNELGHAASVGSQNDLRYAYFPQTQRLAINHGGKVTIYDSGDHQIGGFSQQQGSDQSLTFTSQHGLVRVADLAIVGANIMSEPDSAPSEEGAPMDHPAAPAMFAQPSPAPVKPAAERSAMQSSEGDIFAKIERLADLRKKEILTQQEFDVKKAELLARI